MSLPETTRLVQIGWREQPWCSYWLLMVRERERRVVKEEWCEEGFKWVRMRMRIECMKGEERRGVTNYRDSHLPLIVVLAFILSTQTSKVIVLFLRLFLKKIK